MGFWQGANEGLTYVLESKARQKELAGAKQERMDERAAALEEKAADREYEKEQYIFRMGEARRDSLLSLYMQKEADRAESGKLTGQAQAFLSRLDPDSLEDPRVQALLKNPKLTAQLEEQVLTLEKDMEKQDVDAPFLRGQNLLDAITIFDPDTGTVAASNITLDDLMSMDMTDRSVYGGAMVDLSRTQTSGAYATIKPEMYRVADPKKLEEGRRMFDQLVLSQARADLNNYDEASGEWADLNAQIEGYKTEDSAERMKLQELYGYSVYKTLLNTDNRYTQGFKNDPQFGQFSTRYNNETQTLRQILVDPEASQTDKDGASAELRARGLS